MLPLRFSREAVLGSRPAAYGGMASPSCCRRDADGHALSQERGMAAEMGMSSKRKLGSAGWLGLAAIAASLVLAPRKYA